ncbi:MAG: DUF2065 domain-containing protein [Xanthomonadaceae bacterium]|nr:DUF2065 domain-containing protein [Xanthomonadaceae bacterium]
MFDDLLLAFSLVLILEGLLPALSPRGWRQAVERLGELSDPSIRRFGIAMIIIGAAVFHLAS